MSIVYNILLNKVYVVNRCVVIKLVKLMIISRSSNPMGSMGSFGIPQSRTFGSQGAMSNFHSVFGGSGGGDASTPPLLDLSLSEFPSLTNRGQGDSMPQPSAMPGKQAYGKSSFLYLEIVLLILQTMNNSINGMPCPGRRG